MPAASRYEIVAQIAKGDFATVFRGRDHELGRDVAIKQIHQQYLDDPRQLDRYWQEAQLLASLEHPHIMTIYDVVRERGWLILELAQGSLPQLLGGRGIDLKDLRLTLSFTLHALKFMHAHGIVHGDVKPSNLLVDRNQRVKLGDFGIARRLQGDDGSVVKGTTKYMAPEVVSDQFGPVGPHSDLYSLGFTAYDLMCGEHFESLFPGLNMYGRDRQVAWMMWHSAADRRVPEVQRVLQGVPPDLARIVMRLVEKDPARRYRTADEALADLSTAGEAPPQVAHGSAAAEAKPAATDTRRRRALAIAAVAGSLVLSVGMLFIPGSQPQAPPQPVAAAAQATAGQIVEVDQQRSRFFIDAADGGQPQGVTVRPEVDRVFVNGERAALADLRTDDTVRIEHLTGAAGSFQEIYATRELAAQAAGLLDTVDAATGAVALSVADGGSLELLTNDVTKYSLNGKAAKLAQLQPQDRVEVEHQANRAGQRLATRITALRTLKMAATLAEVRDGEIVVRPDSASGPGASTSTVAVNDRCVFTLNGQAADQGRPLSAYDLRAGDTLSIEYDVAASRVEALRDVMESGVVTEVDYDQHTFRAQPDSGETVSFIVPAGSVVQLADNATPVAFDFLRPGDRVSVERKSPDPAEREAARVTVSPQHDPRTWAVIIGYGQYDNADLPALPTAGADAASVRTAWLTYCRVPPKQLLVEQDATRSRLESEVPRFLSTVAPDSQLLVYVAAHGYRDEQGVGYVVPQGFDARRAASTALPLRWLIQQLEQCAAREKLLLLDTSHAEADAAYPSSAELAATVKENPRRPVSTSVTVIASCDAGQNGQKLETEEHGAFASALQAAWRGGDVNRDQRVDANELFAFLQREMAERVAAAGAAQTPALFLPDATPPRISAEAKAAVLRLLAYLHRRLDDQIVYEYDAARQATGEQPDAGLAYGLALLRGNRAKAAADLLNEVRLKHPQALVAYQALAWKAFWEGGYKDGVAQLEQLARRLPDAREPSDQRYQQHVLGFAGRLSAFAELVKKEVAAADLQALRQTIAERGEAAKTAYRDGYFAVREQLTNLDSKLAAEADPAKRTALERDRSRLTYYVDMNYDEPEMYLREMLDR